MGKWAMPADLPSYQARKIPAGRDTKYGFGLVQAKAAYDRIKSLGCGM